MASETTRVALGGPVDLVVRIGRGRLRITAREGVTEATVRLASRQGHSEAVERTTVELQGSELRVQGPRAGGLRELVGPQRRDRGAMDVSIEVPTGTRVEVASASEHVAIEGCCGDVEVATSARGIEIGSVGGELRLRSGHAHHVRVGSVAGMARIQSGSGRVAIGATGGALECTIGRGELEAGEIRGALRARIGVGSVTVRCAGGDVDIASGSGRIAVGIPAGVSARVDAGTGLGRVTSELPVDAEPASPVAITLRAQTGTGDIRLGRAEVA